MTAETRLDRFVAALEAGEEETVAELLQQEPGLAVTRLPDGWPVFLLQSVFPSPAVIDLMIAHGADPDARNPAGETLLHLTGDPEAIRKLRAVGADLNARDQAGLTPMMAHAPWPETGPDAILTLLAEGADPSLAGPEGQTAATLLPEGARFDRLRQLLRDAEGR